ncbi:unnamed protein product [Closterium sp. NIES-53]
MRNEGGIDDDVDGGARISGNNGTKQRGVIKVDGGVDRSQARVQWSTVALEVAGLKGLADGTVSIPPMDDFELLGEFRAAHLLTVMVISRDDLYIGQLEEKMTHIWMGEQESATDFCNHARRILAEIRMAGAEYSTASYIFNIIKGLLRGYNLMKRMMMVPGTRESLDEDSITGYILQDEAMQLAKQPTELLPQANYAAPTKLNQQQGQRKKPSGGGSGGGQSTKDVNEKRSTRDKGCGGGGRRRECLICHEPDHLSYECPDHDDSDEDDTKVGRGRSTSLRPRRDAMPRKEKQKSKKTLSTKDVDNSSCKSRGNGEASCSMVGVVEPTVSLVPEAGEDFQAVAAALQANPMAHVRGFNGALQPVKGCGTVALQGEAEKRVLIPDVLYVPGVQVNLLFAGQLKESEVQPQGNGDEMLLVAATEEVLGRARYNGRVLCTDLRPCSMQSTLTKVVTLRTIVSATKSTPVRLHVRLVHVGVNTIKSSAKHEVATGLNIKQPTGADPPCVSCIGGKLAPHTFPDKGSDAEEAVGVMHIDLCGPFPVAAKDGSLYFLLLKDRHTRFVWVMPVAKKSDVLREFQKWLVLVERQAKKSVLMLRSDRGGEFLGKEFTDFVDGKGIVHDLTCPSTPQPNCWCNPTVCIRLVVRVRACVCAWNERYQRLKPLCRNPSVHSIFRFRHIQAYCDYNTNGIAELQMCTADESVRTMLLHMGVQHYWWHLALRQAVRVRNCLEWSTTPPGTTPYQLLPTSRWRECGAEHQRVDEPDDEDVVEVLPTPPALAPPFLIADRPASTLVDVVEAPITQPELRRTSRARRLPERLRFHACLPPAAFTTVYDEVDDDLLYDDAKADEELPELDPDVHANPEHRWDIATMTVKEAMVSWKGEAVKAAMEEEICSLIGMGTWELVKRPRGVNIMKSRWVLTTKYRIDDTVEREKARLVVKGFTQVCGADYDKTYLPVSSYVTLRIFLKIPDYFDDGTGRVCKLLKSLYELKHTPLLWYKALDGVLLGAGWKKSQVDKALYFKAGDNRVTCWVLVYVDDLLAASSSPAMLKELKELLEAAFKLREISPVIKYLGLEIVRDRPARKLWLHQ